MLIPVPAQLGYPALGALVLGESAGLPIPGESALLTAGGAAGNGSLSLLLVILVAACAAIVGDTVGYAVGRRGGRAFLLRDGRFAGHRHRAVAKADRLFASWGVIAVFVGRWIPGVRVVAALTAGATAMPYGRFLTANAAGAFCWAATVATFASIVGPTGSLVLIAIGATVTVIAFGVAWVRRGRTARRAVPEA